VPVVSVRGLLNAVYEELKQDGGWLTTRNLCNRLSHYLPPEAIAREKVRNPKKQRQDAASSLMARAAFDLVKRGYAEKRKTYQGKCEYRINPEKIRKQYTGQHPQGSRQETDARRRDGGGDG